MYCPLLLSSPTYPTSPPSVLKKIFARPIILVESSDVSAMWRLVIGTRTPAVCSRRQKLSHVTIYRGRAAKKASDWQTHGFIEGVTRLVQKFGCHHGDCRRRTELRANVVAKRNQTNGLHLLHILVVGILGSDISSVYQCTIWTLLAQWLGISTTRETGVVCSRVTLICRASLSRNLHRLSTCRAVEKSNSAVFVSSSLLSKVRTIFIKLSLYAAICF